MQENSGRQIRREIKVGQLGEKVGKKLGEKVVEKTGEIVGESLEEIHKLDLCLKLVALNKVITKVIGILNLDIQPKKGHLGKGAKKMQYFFSKKGGQVDSKVYIFKKCVHSEKRLQNRFI